MCEPVCVCVCVCVLELSAPRPSEPLLQRPQPGSSRQPPNPLGTAPRARRQPLSLCASLALETAGWLLGRTGSCSRGDSISSRAQPGSARGSGEAVAPAEDGGGGEGTMRAAAGTALQGLFAVYKPPGVHWMTVTETVKLHLIKGLNALKQPEPCQQICFQPSVAEKETGKELTLTVSQVPKLADHPLVSGPVFTQLNVGAGPRLDMHSSGVFVLGVGHGTKLLKDWYNAHLTRAYTVSGLFGKATDNFSDTGKLIEKSTFDHVTREKLERIVSVIQGSNHKALLQPPLSLGFFPRRLYSPTKKPEEPASSEPLSFTKSPANPRRWTAWQSMGSDQRQPAWRALLINLVIFLILLWCYFRPETEADRRAKEFLEYLQNYPLQHQPPSVPSGADEKKP
ncbi:mitochondrial mRNA pseudouridine synthase TRUB2 isoform X2 [Crotalus tigris]|uniref:mitochondrial mRNA pseudouridine synthase TRUB2 isoform X2 n=1 Tax=Crotalus tigris TaxID=88082 RepID=UPI00192F215A|nr:mitochondrial mRNA pseudouridine synthase TRUB2 isoform X2 [Crotalus tigris]